MKEIKGISYDSPKTSVGIDDDLRKALIKRASSYGLSEFLKMTSTEFSIEYKNSDPVKELTEEDLFKNLSDNLKEVYQKIY
jgi:hypothetical protein